MGAKINAAIADLPSTGGIVDATSFQGVQSAAATITLSKPCLLKLGAVTLTASGAPGFNLTSIGAGIEGLGTDTTVLITNSGTADIIQLSAAFWYLSLLGFRSSVTRTGGAAINMAAGGSNGTGKTLRIDKTWNGINCNSSSSTGNSYFNDVQMGSGLSATGNWNAGVFLGNVASGTVASIGFDGMRITGDSSFATAMVVLDSGTDTILFSDCQFVQSGVSNTCLLVQKTGASLTPSWARFVNCSFEAFTAATAINVTSCNNLKFTNCQIANSQTGILVNPASPANVQDMRFINGSFIICQQSSVVLNSCTGGVEVSNCWIADSSQQTNGGFNAITVNGTCTNFWFNHNSFALSGRGSGFLPFRDIAIQNATADSFDLIGNSFIQGIVNNSTGTNYYIHSNIPAQTNIFNGLMQLNNGVNTTRLKPNLGTAFSGADAAIVLGAGWGTTRTVSAAAGFDQAFQFTVNATGTGQAASPTITITYKNGTWTNAPIVDVSRNDNATPTTSTFFPVWTTTATVLTITMNGTPTASQIYIFTVMVFGT